MWKSPAVVVRAGLFPIRSAERGGDYVTAGSWVPTGVARAGSRNINSSCAAVRQTSSRMIKSETPLSSHIELGQRCVVTLEQ
jgi:hypothetical protein